MRRIVLALLATALLRADMYPDASNAKLPEAQQHLGITSISAGLYGVVGDRRDVAADLTVAAGSASATTTTTTFTSADVGKFLLVYGAGSSSRALSTTIAAVTGQHAITLGNAAVAAVSGAGFEYASNPQAGLQAAINAAEAQGGGRVVIPPGKYIIRAPNRINLKNNVTLDGENGAEIRCDDSINGATAPENACIYSFGQNNLVVQNFRIKGMLDLNPSPLPVLSAPISLNNGTHATMTGMDISWTRSNGALIWGSKRVIVNLNKIHHVLWAGVDVSGGDGAVISNNEISYCNDNPIAVGVGDTATAPSPLSNTSVTGNIITECWSTALSGAKSTTFSNNLVKRTAHQALFVAPYTNFSNGDTAMVGVTVASNVFLDLIKTTPAGQAPPTTAAYIVLNGAQRKAGSLASVPGYPAAGTGTVTDLYGAGPGRYWALDTDAAGVASPGGGGWTVSNNVMMRTLPAVAAATDWGYGGLWNGMRTTAAAPYTGAVTEADLGADCITITGPLRNARIGGNICNTTGDYGILFDTLFGVYVPKDGDYDGLTISDNKFIDYKISGLSINPAAVFTSQVLVARNEFNSDPRFVSSNRGPGGTWLVTGAPHGVANLKMSGMQIEGSHFRNLNIPIATGGGTAVITSRNNTIYGTIAGDGFNVANVGVGSVSNTLGVYESYHVVHEDGVPASATFGKQLTPSGDYSPTVPTSGAWLSGTMVWKKVPILQSNGSVWLGWMRITTGSSNVDGVDWRAVYSSPLTATGGLVATNTTVEALPPCNAAAKYTTQAVSNASAPAWNATVVGAGGFAVPVMCDGAAWKVR